MARFARLPLWLSLGMALLAGAAALPALAKDPHDRVQIHTIEEGEAVWTIARAYGVSLESIKEANPTVDLARVRPGDELRIVGSKRRVRRSRQKARTDSRPSRSKTRAAARARALDLGTRRAASMLLMGRAEPAWIRATGRSDRLEGSLRWPVTKGWFVRGFGSGAGGYHQATDIGGEVGWNVRAAAAGLVGYAGDDLDGFGNVVLVIHQGGWITLYGHNSKNKVVAGERVRRGEVLAEIGSTGKSQGPHVHFELLFRGENCDPSSLFRPGVRTRDGGHQKVPRRFWRDPERKPRSIACHPRKKHPGPDS